MSKQQSKKSPVGSPEKCDFKSIPSPWFNGGESESKSDSDSGSDNMEKEMEKEMEKDMGVEHVNDDLPDLVNDDLPDLDDSSSEGTNNANDAELGKPQQQQPSESQSQNSALYNDPHGFTYDEYKKNPQKYKTNVAQCLYCSRFYDKSSNGMLTFDYDEGGSPVCYHCLFWMNYNIHNRPNVDGVYGKTILEYIMECKDSHNFSTCLRNSDCCVICDHLKGIPIENILGGEQLCQNEKQPIMINENDDDFSMEITI